MRFSTHSVITIVFMSHILFFKNICVTKYFYKLLWVTTFTMCTVTIAAVITSGLFHTACSHSYWNKTGCGSVGMFKVIKTGWLQHGQLTISSNALLFVFWITRAMEWGRHKWVWDKAPVSRLKLSKFRQDLNPLLNVIFRPGHGILSRYWNSHFSGTMVRHPHHDN